MNIVAFFILAFVIVYLFYLVTVVLQKKRFEKFKLSNQVLYFKNRFKLDIEKLNIKSFVNIISLINAFIIACGFSIAMLVENFLLQLLIGFIVIIILTFLCYEMYGKILRKKEK